MCRAGLHPTSRHKLLPPASVDSFAAMFAKMVADYCIDKASSTMRPFSPHMEPLLSRV